jgi:hypothetical protein
MTAKLTPAEIARCIQIYMGAKLGVMPDTLTVCLHWRGRYATVETGKGHPAMSDEDKRAIGQ